MGPNEILHQCVLEHEKPIVLNEAHDSVTGSHMLVKLQYKIYYKQDRGGILCMHMLEIIVASVISSREMEICHDRMKCC